MFAFVFENWHENRKWYIRINEKDGKRSTYEFVEENSWRLTCAELKKIQEEANAVH